MWIAVVRSLSSESSGKVERESRNKHTENIVKKEVRMTFWNTEGRK